MDGSSLDDFSTWEQKVSGLIWPGLDRMRLSPLVSGFGVGIFCCVRDMVMGDGGGGGGGGVNRC